MSSSDEAVDSFVGMFKGPPTARRQARQSRIEKERHTQLTEKQRGRRGERTEQISFRCSPEYNVRVRAMRDHLGGMPIADIHEAALDLLEKEKGIKK